MQSCSATCLIGIAANSQNSVMTSSLSLSQKNDNCQLKMLLISRRDLFLRAHDQNSTDAKVW